MPTKKRKNKAQIAKNRSTLSPKRQKPGQQTNTRYKSLAAKVKKEFKRQGISTECMQFIDNPDCVKMSEVILQLAEPLMKKYGDDNKRIETIVALTIMEWNRLMLPKAERNDFQDMMLDKLVPPGEDAETVGSLLYLSDFIAERKKKYFPDLKKVILSHEVIVSDGEITLNISSAPIASGTKRK